MRTWFAWFAVWGLSSLGACGTTPAVTVIRDGSVTAESVKGDPLKIRRGAQEVYGGVHGGFFVVRGAEDWRVLWPDGNAPALPPTLDTSRSMLLVAVAESKDTLAMQVRKVVDAGGQIYVFVKESKPGDGCIGHPDRPGFDGVVVERLDKPVKFFVEEEKGEACGDPPKPEVQCRIGEANTWSGEITAQPGDTIDCTMTATSHGRFEITDRVLALGDLPGGSGAKLAYTKGSSRGTFVIDVFGKYSVRAEATDDGGRRGTATARIDVLPPKTKDVLVQLVWSGFDASDDPETFPRVKLRAAEPGAAKGQAGRECTADHGIAGVCEAKAQSAYTHMKLAAGTRKMPLTVTYSDERVDKGPLVCVQVYFDGERTAETCDRQHRNPDDKWDVGVIDVAAGTLLEPQGGKAGADAGAPAPSPAPAKTK